MSRYDARPQRFLALHHCRPKYLILLGIGQKVDVRTRAANLPCPRCCFSKGSRRPTSAARDNRYTNRSNTASAERRHTFVTTMLDAGVDLRDVQIAARHADPRTTMRYDRARKNLDRHPNYILAAYMASGT